MKRFVHELRYSRKITHKNVIRIYDSSTSRAVRDLDGVLPLHTLGSEVVNDKPIELQRALQFGIDMCTGMTVAHPGRHRAPRSEARQRAHQPGGTPQDRRFGVAAAQREGDTQLTKTGYVIGSPKYMAPEQILGKKVDERADIYAVGCHDVRNADRPAALLPRDHMSVMYQHVQGRRVCPGSQTPRFPRPLRNLIMKAMSVDKTKRFQTMVELSAALEGFSASARRAGARDGADGLRLAKVRALRQYFHTSR